MDKSYVTIENKICPVCGKQHNYDCGILLDKKVRDIFEKETITGYALCEEHQKMYDDGFIALIAIDENKSGIENKDINRVTIENAYRTGDVFHIRKEAAVNMLNLPEGELDREFVFIDHKIAEIIQEKMDDRLYKEMRVAEANNLDNPVYEICGNCGYTRGSHLSNSGKFNGYPDDCCPSGERTMDWKNGPGTCFEPTGNYKEL